MCMCLCVFVSSCVYDGIHIRVCVMCEFMSNLDKGLRICVAVCWCMEGYGVFVYMNM